MITATQREILEALIQLYEKKKETIKGEDISDVLHRTAGTIRNQMQTLKAMGYVEGIPGPKGGYTPALKAYEALDMEVVNTPYIVPIFRDGKPVEGVNVQKIIFSQVHHPTACMSMVTVLGDTRQIRDHDMVTVGPTPVNHIVLKGEIVGRDDTRRELLIASHSISSIPKGKVSEVMSKNVISVSPATRIKECARTLAEKRISSLPVLDKGKLVGLVTEAEIVRAVASGQLEGTAGDVAVRNPLTVESEERLIDCIEKMKKHDVGRLIVTTHDKPVGIVTRTDILSRMLE